MNTYTLYWKDGEKEVIEGLSPEDAMRRAGLGMGALSALDFWVEGDDRDYEWNDSQHQWIKKEKRK